MQKPDFRYWVLWIFLAGVIVIVFLQVVSGYNINRLVIGNRNLIHETDIRNDLRRLETDLVTIESDIRGGVITQNNALFQDALSRTAQSNQQLERMQHRTVLVKDSNFRLLQNLIARKNIFNNAVYVAFTTKGKPAAEAIINTGQGQKFRDSIFRVISTIDRQRAASLQEVVVAAEATGRRARIWGFVVTFFALGAVVLAFWYIVNQGKRQQKMIELLNQSEKRSKEVAHMKEQFLANMSHEIRTPMNSILGFTNLLRRTNLDGSQREYVQSIHSAGENLLTLVNDILDLSKIEAGMMQLEEIRFSLNSLIHSVSAMFTEKINQKSLIFQTSIDPKIPDILCGDAVRLTQILVNLLSNAVKFTEEGSIRIGVELLGFGKERVRLQFKVTDTGIGIAKEKQATVFERFQQAEAETTRRYGGTGLGLSIVKQLVDLLKGSIRLESEPGKGSAFIVELIFELPDIEQLYSEAMSSTNEPVSLQEIRVLIAEDNAMNQQLINHLMKSWAIEHHIVDNGRKALEALASHHYDLVLMDIQMPEMDGYLATTHIRQEMGLDIPIIAMTAHAMIGEKEKCLQLGMNDYISKPLKETVLYNMIARHAPVKGKQIKLDLTYLHELSGNDQVFEKQILEQFTIQMPREIAEMDAAFSARDASQIKKIAHSMKSTIGYVGLADELNPLFENVEAYAHEYKLEEAQLNFDHIREKCNIVLQEVATLLDE